MKQVNQGSNIYCGPAVLSIVSGKNTDECARVINKIRSKPSYTDVKEIYSETELPKALDMLGFDIERVAIDEDSSLLWTLHMICNIEGMYIIQVPAHVVAVEVKDKRVYLCDNHTKEPINAANSARIGQRVAKVWSVRERPKPTLYKHRVVRILHSEQEIIFYSKVGSLDKLTYSQISDLIVESDEVDRKIPYNADEIKVVL